MKTKTFGKANDSFDNFDEEYTLAQLIQNAAARGLTSVRGTLFGRPKQKGEKGVNTMKVGKLRFVTVESTKRESHSVTQTCKRMSAPPEGTTCACVLGAQMLTPRIKNPILTVTVTQANDAGDKVEIDEYIDERSANIGAAYEQALRPY